MMGWPRFDSGHLWENGPQNLRLVISLLLRRSLHCPQRRLSALPLCWSGPTALGLSPGTGSMLAENLRRPRPQLIHGMSDHPRDDWGGGCRLGGRCIRLKTEKHAHTGTSTTQLRDR